MPRQRTPRPEPDTPATPDLRVTVQIDIVRSGDHAAGADVNLCVTGDERLVDLFEAAEKAGTIRPAVSGMVDAIAAALGAHRTTAECGHPVPISRSGGRA